MIDDAISKLVAYALQTGLTQPCEKDWAVNTILDALKLDGYTDPGQDWGEVELAPVLEELLDDAHARGVLTENSVVYRDLFDTVNANLEMSIFAETKCSFSPVSTEVYTALIHHFTCRLEARQALIYQLVSSLTGENGKYNYSRAVHVYPPFFDIHCSAKNYKIAPALTTWPCLRCRSS